MLRLRVEASGEPWMDEERELPQGERRESRNSGLGSNSDVSCCLCGKCLLEMGYSWLFDSRTVVQIL